MLLSLSGSSIQIKFVVEAFVQVALIIDGNVQFGSETGGITKT
jgi:hypothetical protein